MSKEMFVIVLGVWSVVLTQLGIPYHPWGVLLFVITGVAIAVLGFLLRGEALGRGGSPGEVASKRTTYPFVESAAHTPPPESHEHKEGTPTFN